MTALKVGFRDAKALFLEALEREAEDFVGRQLCVDFDQLAGLRVEGNHRHRLRVERL